MGIVTRAVLPKDDRGNDPNDHRDDPDYLQKVKRHDPLDWVSGFTVSKEEAEMLDDPEWIYPNLLISGHILVTPGAPNEGKTTIWMWVASQIAKDWRVFYVNADTGAGDAKAMVQQAHESGFTLLLPDMKVGLSMENVVDQLAAMAESDETFQDVVFIFDTLKKMTDVINKSHAKKLYRLLRALSAKGMTIVLLAHTNKYRDADGKPIYEGTGDLRSDVDELLYFVGKKEDDGSMIVSTIPDKTRGSFLPISFCISPDREVSQNGEYVDTVAERRAQQAYEADLPEIEIILAALSEGLTKQSEIVEHCKGHRVGKRTALRLLRDYSKGSYHQWEAKRGFEKNVIQYFRLK